MLNKIQYKLYIGILIIIVSLIGNIIYINSQKLKEPIFFQHYYEDLIRNQSCYIDINYLTNAEDNVEVISIFLPNINDSLWVKYTNVEKYKYYDKKNAQIEINFYKVENEFNKNNKMIIDKAIVTFNNGQKMEVDLGKIIIHKDENSSHLDQIMTGSSSSGTTKDVYKVDKDIIINSITTDLIEESKGLIKMNIISNSNRDLEMIDKLRNNDEKNAEDLIDRKIEGIANIPFEDITFPIAVKESLTIYTAFDKPNSNKKYNFYRILYAIDYENKDGEKGKNYLLNVNYHPYFSNKDIREFITSRGE